MTDYIKEKYPDLENACNRRLMYAYLSTLSQLAKSNKKDIKNEEKLMIYIKENRKKILKDKRVPKRDKIGLYSSLFGFGFYKYIWNLYSIFTKRI